MSIVVTQKVIFKQDNILDLFNLWLIVF